ncbi:hypothetical protein NHU_01726 [Rhodovulum sulfidophilum]|uniref:Uncharacterized protein n=1 Tax=Rhodovulum sulfidophilum TaxID=35806 RepID=A0A0D6B1J9_RHOSU|nr:hypothetical protein NHU_01726 [Rhodovulum sulfidophilum]
MKPGPPLCQTHLSCGLCDRYAARGVAVQDGGADPELGDLVIEVAYHQALLQRRHAVHLRLDVASAMVSAPLSSDAAAEVFRGAASFLTMAPAADGFHGPAVLRG